MSGLIDPITGQPFPIEQGGAEPREAHNLDSAGSTPAPATNPPDFRRFTMGEIVPLKGMVFRVRGVDVSQGRQWLILEYQGITAKEERRLKLVKG